ncbi:PucR family transcriptional regulator [Candidatus Enterococcus murrayae]|uniref:PucR family transcriptional regulator ligand-binding domain-containing protein n=1 Tax=Candidatus Enterococcus murrayae TaxID=2815321 RepID=A0ABS3HG96_9ENTE|nr:PucR family transcriptional regulator [Enterococcus sp. MJM16]MBO0452476.1 PucR family transcriptional regulator ligand-binding domain-containing protein [Enterococcus sp. MJM16]
MRTILDLLQIPRFSDLILLTNAEYANLQVDSIEISETPDISFYIPEKTFLLTTAMIYQNDQSQIFNLIDSLQEKNAAGLGIKVGRYIDEIEQQVIDYANQKQFPIVQIPISIPLGSLLHQMLNLLWDKQTEQLNYALDIQRRFSNMLVNDVSIARFISDFGRLINTPVILVDPYKRVYAASKHFSKTTKPAEYYIDQVKLADPNFVNKKEDSILIKDLDQKTFLVSYFSVEHNHYFPHSLVILNPEKIPYPVSNFALEQAALVLSFMLYKNQKIQESYDILKTDFLTRMIEIQQAPNQEPRDWLDSGTTYGLVKARHYRVVYVACQQKEPYHSKIRYQEEVSQIGFHWLSDKLAHHIKDVTLFKVKDTAHYAIVVQHKQENLENILKTVAADLFERLDIQLQFGIGTIYDSIDDIAKSYIEAKTAFEEMQLLSTLPLTYQYQQKGMRSLFEKMGPSDITYFCEITLKKLAYPKEASMIELRKTLKYYLDFHCEIARTAKALFVHRNTIKYRIDQCNEIIGKNIHDSGVSLDLRLALELSEEDNL